MEAWPEYLSLFSGLPVLLNACSVGLFSGTLVLMRLGGYVYARYAEAVDRVKSLILEATHGRLVPVLRGHMHPELSIATTFQAAKADY
jgi:hypothetical protein